MINVNDVKIGQKLYFVNQLERIEECEVLDFDKRGEDCLEVHHLNTVNSNGRKIYGMHGMSYEKISNLFITLEDALAFIKAEEEKRFIEYKESIKDLKDLLNFPILNNFSDENGSQDGLMVQAYRERAFELTGIELVVS